MSFTAHSVGNDELDRLMSDTQNKSAKISLPPRLPQNRQELDRSIILLGNRKQNELSAEARRELEILIGVYPTLKEAAIWKRELRRVVNRAIQDARSERREEL
jgi:hypothetical protein